MAKTPSGTVKETGAKAGDVLIGVMDSNRNMQIKLHRNQKTGYGGRIEGGFDLESAGDGVYAKAMEDMVGESFQNASEFISRVASKPGALKCTHVVNRNMLRVWSPSLEGLS